MSISNLQLNNITLPTPSEVDRIRYPEQVFTDGYLNNPILFISDQRFLPRTVIDQLMALPTQAQRDFGNFYQVDSNETTPQYVSINTYSPIKQRNAYNKVISEDRRAFKELV